MKDQELNFEGVEKEPLKSFAERAYLLLRLNPVFALIAS